MGQISQYGKANELQWIDDDDAKEWEVFGMADEGTGGLMWVVFAHWDKPRGLFMREDENSGEYVVGENMARYEICPQEATWVSFIHLLILSGEVFNSLLHDRV